MLSLPNEILLKIIYNLRTSSSADLYTLRCWPLVCKQFALVVYKYRKDIIEYYTVMTIKNECERYDFCGLLHRSNDMPAVIQTNGSQAWYINGELHRGNDLPAVIYASGSQCWFVNDRRHRGNDLPAVVDVDGSREWFVDGKKHRDNGKPAVIWASGRQEWWTHGQYMGWLG